METDIMPDEDDDRMERRGGVGPGIDMDRRIHQYRGRREDDRYPPHVSESQGWRLDKSFGPALILGLFIQLGGAVWYVSQTAATIADHDRRITKFESQASSDASNSARLSDKISDKLDAVGTRLTRIETRLQVLPEGSGK